MINLEGQIYKFILKREITTLMALQRIFCLPELETKFIVNALVRKRLIKSDLITHKETGLRLKIYKSPITDELKNVESVSFDA